MQGAEQQKAETTHLERELLGDHIYAHIYWVYTEPQPVLVQDKATKECVIIPSSRTGGGWWLCAGQAEVGAVMNDGLPYYLPGSP